MQQFLEFIIILYFYISGILLYETDGKDYLTGHEQYPTVTFG